MRELSDIELTYLRGECDDQDIIRFFQAQRKDSMRSKGAVYTPDWVAKTMISRLEIASLDLSIIEPSCGHGAFILPLLDHIQTRFSLGPAELKQWFLCKVRCLDIDPDVVRDLRRIVALRFRRDGMADTEPSEFTNIREEDALKAEITGFDIAIGNPPYIRTQGLDPHYRQWLRDSFPVARKGNIDLYYLFLDRYMTEIPRCIFIVPNGCLHARSAQPLRERVFPHLDEVIDYREQLVFPGVRTYTCILKSRLGHSGLCQLSRSPEFEPRPSRWQDLAPAVRPSTPKLARSGVATLADDVFVLPKDPDTGLPYGAVNGSKFWIEPAITRPFLKVSRAFDAAVVDRFILFPYATTSPSSLLPEEDLIRGFPIAYAYLCAKRERLLSRDGGKTDSYPSWYAFGRTQGFHDLSSREIIFIPRVIGGNAVPRLVDTTRLTEAHGSPLHVSGFAVEATPEARRFLLGDHFRDYIREHGKPRPGATEPFYAISSRHVNDYLADHR